jgi:hypothetical protein
LIGSILIGGAEPMHREDMQAGYADLYRLIAKAGYEVGKNGKMSKDTDQAIIKRTTYSQKALVEFCDLSNLYWKSFKPVKNNEVKINNQAKELKLNSGGIKSFLAGMALQYNPGLMPDFSGGIQFKLDNKMDLGQFEHKHYSPVRRSRSRPGNYHLSYPYQQTDNIRDRFCNISIVGRCAKNIQSRTIY